MILNCVACKPHQQDTIHGKGRRVFNELARKDKQPPSYRCTVCGTVVTPPQHSHK